MKPTLHLYTDTTPNGYRASIILEESELPYEAIRTNTANGEHLSEGFAYLNPARAIPVLVDDEGPGGQVLRLPQSGAIILYIAEKIARYLPTDPWRRAQMHRWFFQVATDVTAASSWVFQHATRMPAKTDENRQWLEQRLLSQLRVTENWLAQHEYLADEISVADFLLYPNFWFRQKMLLSDGSFPNLCRWGASMARRPAIQRAMTQFDTPTP